MVYNQYKYRFFIYSLLLGMDSILFAFSLINRWWYSTAFFFLGWIIIVYFIFQTQQKTNRLLSNFLSNIRFNDFNIEFDHKNADKSLIDLKNKLNILVGKFREMNKEREKHLFYIQNVIEHIDIGIIAFNEEGKIILINQSLLKLIDVKRIENIGALQQIDFTFFETINSIEPCENRLINLHLQNQSYKISLYASQFNSDNEIIKLVSVKNIRQELDKQEIDSWQKLISVLTHEIMNSIAPISSLSSTVGYLLEDVEEKEENILMDKENYQDTKEALVTIHNRSEGLMHFVQTFRNLTKIPIPKPEIVVVSELLENVTSVYRGKIEEKNIALTIHVTPDEAEIHADRGLMEQVLINLLKNAIEAVGKAQNPEITIESKMNRFGQTEISIKDNGQGILPEVQEKIFIPFFTTKVEGSGIGLSLSRQIINMHNGTINVSSEPGNTKFTITL